MQVAEEFTGEGEAHAGEVSIAGRHRHDVGVDVFIAGSAAGRCDQVAGEAHHRMLVAERVVGISARATKARDSEDLVVVIGMLGQQLRPADDRFVSPASLPA
ncbi:hypothetical protein H351_30185 (plasmid) [Rhodococcus erythropolis R138]|nr:hypothetical protein H351_30185 [Rhodococcus erythropolis R138]